MTPLLVLMALSDCRVADEVAALAFGLAPLTQLLLTQTLICWADEAEKLVIHSDSGCINQLEATLAAIQGWPAHDRFSLRLAIQQQVTYHRGN